MPGAVALRLRREGCGVPAFSDLDTRWITDGMIKRRSNYSPVICFETSDPRRLYQLKHHVLTASDPAPEQVYVYDRWDGLSRLKRGEGGIPAAEPYRKAPGGGSSPLSRRITEGQAELLQFKSALREVDGFLKEQRTTFIIQNVADNREWESGLQSALRAWALDAAVIARGSVVFLVTADASSLLDEYTRELVVVISVDPSSAREREQVLGSLARELGVPPEGYNAPELILATAGLTLHQLESVLLESYHRSRTFSPDQVKRLKSELVKKSGILEVKEPGVTFGDVGGYEAIKEFVRRNIIEVLRDSSRARRFQLPLPRGILFFGPPGTGKSLFAAALASEVQLPFIHLVTENIYSKWLGESGQKMKNAIRLAEKMSPAIVFVDEIDRFGRRGGIGGDSAGEETRRVFSQFLEWLGSPDREAIVVGTTNVPEHLDEAFLRTGRFDYKIPFLYPGEAARLEIMAVHLGLSGDGRRRSPPLAGDEAACRSHLAAAIIPRTQSFSGAELEELVTRAKRQAFIGGAAAVGPEHFDRAAATFRIDRQGREAETRRYLAQAQRFTDDQTFLDRLEQEMAISF